MKPKPEVLKTIAQNYIFPETIPEKDYWVINLIKKLSELSFSNGSLIFGGGTSLVKAHRVMKRFSEDIDFRFISDVPLNRSKKSNVKHLIADYLKTLPEYSLLEEPVGSNENTLIFYKIDYPHDEYFSGSYALRPFIKLEVFFTDIYS